MAGYGYGISVSGSRTPVVASGGGEIIPSSGLSLWLKADAGVTRISYVSEIVLTCTGGLSSYSGTYIATSTPDVDGAYTLACSANFKNILKEGFYSEFIIGPDFTLASSGNGINWSLQNVLVTGLTISGSDNADVNGFYGLNERNQSTANLVNNNGYNLNTNTSGVCEILALDNTTVLYSNSSNGSGTWTNESGTGHVTASSIQLDPSGTVSGSITTSLSQSVTNWADQSGNGNNATPVDANPNYNSSDLNSKPTISLSSVAVETNKSFQISGNPMGASGTTAFVVNYVDPNVFSVDGEDGDANGALLGNFGGGENGSHWPYGLGTSSVYDSFATDTRKNDLGLPTGITSWNIYSVYSEDNDWKLFCNGTEFYSDPSNVYSNAIANSTSLYIGMQNNAGEDQIFKGKVAEVVIYNRVLTSVERQQVEAYLNTKYAIY